MKKKLRTPISSVLKAGHYFYYLKHWILSYYRDFRATGHSMNATVFNVNPDAYPVQSLNYLYLQELVEKSQIKNEPLLIDVGCAWGRVLAYLEKTTSIPKLIGVELNEEIARKAAKVFRNSERVEIICADITENVPQEASAFYLFNPFSGEVLRRFLHEVEQQCRQPVTLYYLHPTCREVIDRAPQWELKEEIILQPKYYGELLLCVYQKE